MCSPRRSTTCSQVCLDDFHTETKKIYVRCPTCHKRQIENPLSEGATYWLIDDVMMRRQRCEPCGEELQLQQCTMDASRGIPMSSLILQPIEDVPELKFCSEKMRYGRPFETSYTLHKLLGQPSSEALDKLKASGEDGIRHEMVEFYCSQSGKDAGSRDKDEYVGWPLIALDGLCDGLSCHQIWLRLDRQGRVRRMASDWFGWPLMTVSNCL